MVINNSHLWLKNTEIFGKAFERERKTFIWCRKEGFSKIFVWSLERGGQDILAGKGDGLENWGETRRRLCTCSLICIYLACVWFALYCLVLYLLCICSFLLYLFCTCASLWGCTLLMHQKKKKPEEGNFEKHSPRICSLLKTAKMVSTGFKFFSCVFLYKFPNKEAGV